MVRLSLIVLGLLAAAWCATANPFAGIVRHSMMMRNQKVLYDTMECSPGNVLSIGTCKKMTTSCSRPLFRWFSVKCISKGQHKIIKQSCNKKESCKIKAPIEKGSYACETKCVKA